MNDKQLTPEEEEKEMMLLPKLAITKLLLKKIEQTATLQARVQELEKENNWPIIQALIRCGLANNPTEAFKHQVRRLQQKLPQDSAEFESITQMLNTDPDEPQFKIVQSRIAELESAVTEWRYATGAANERTWKVQKELADSQQHAEKLMGLLEHFYLKYQLRHDDAKDWQSYKQEHGLQSPENLAS